MNSGTGKRVEGNHGGSVVGIVTDFGGGGGGAAEWCHVRLIQCSLRAAEFQTLVTVSIACCAEINRHAAWSSRALPSVNWCSQLSWLLVPPIVVLWQHVEVVFVAAFAKLRKATIGYDMSVRTKKKKLGFHWTNVHEIRYLSIFRKSVEKVQVWLISGKNKTVMYV